MTKTLDNLIVVADQASALIRAEVHAGEQRKQLERAIREASVKMDANLNELSAVSGLTVAEIRKILAAKPELELDEICGVA